MAVKLDRWEAVDERSRDDLFAELYESSYPSLVKYCRGLLGKGADPEEVAQEAFLRAWTTWDRYATSRPFWALVATIARNLCMDHHRHERVVSTVLEQRAGELSSAPAVTPEERLEQDEEYAWARRALAELCPNHQRILHLREIEGWSADDIAAADGTSPEAATAALYRARQRLRDAYHRVAAGALAGLAYFPVRGMRRRLGVWAHYGGQTAATSPGLAAHASNAVAAVVAIAVVSAAPVVNAPPPTAAADRPAPAVAEATHPVARAGVITAVASDQAGADAGTATPNATAGAAAAPVANPVVAGAPEDVAVSQFAAPPAGSTSRELYATGTSAHAQGCTSPPPCAVLFHSADSGATWQRLQASGFSGGTILLAPNFPTDRRVFATGPNGLQVSEDQGATFSTLVPLTGPAAISPAFPVDHRILIGAVPGWEYRDDTGTTTPLRFYGRPPGHTLSLAFSPSYTKDGKLFVGSTAPDPTNPAQQTTRVTVCVFDKCGGPAVLAGADGLPTVQASSSFATTGVVYAWAHERLYRSADGGQSFTPVTLPATAAVQSVTEDPDGTVYVAVLSTDPKGITSGGVYVTGNGGKTWTQLGKDTALAKGSSSILSLGHDRLLAAPAASGLVCSADAGKTWANRCPTTP